jgi:predicted GIY-YIG superfamily endonuclease
MKTHQSGKGSKYIRSRGFCCLIGSKHCFNRSEALKLEYKLKQLSQEEKLEFFS